MWVDSGYVSLGDSTYLPVPMVLSSEGYGLYLDSSRHSVFDMASDGARVVIQNPSPEMRLYIWPGQDYPELLGKYAKITGFPAAPPEWAFGIWLSRCSYSEQAEVLGWPGAGVPWSCRWGCSTSRAGRAGPGTPSARSASPIRRR